MSLHNQLVGFYEGAPLLMLYLFDKVDDIKFPSREKFHEIVMEIQKSIPRFRDCYVEDDYIVIYTRTGGGNREYYKEQNEWLRSIPGYVKDVDDDFDETFAHFYYEIPKKYKPHTEVVRMTFGERNPSKAFQQLIKDLGDPSKQDQPDVKHAREYGKELLKGILGDDE